MLNGQNQETGKGLMDDEVNNLEETLMQINKPKQVDKRRK